MTNADKIRAMSDEELAQLLTDLVLEGCCGCPTDCPLDPRYDDRVGCEGRFLKWLRDVEDRSCTLIMCKHHLKEWLEQEAKDEQVQIPSDD